MLEHLQQRRRQLAQGAGVTQTKYTRGVRVMRHRWMTLGDDDRDRRKRTRAGSGSEMKGQLKTKIKQEMQN